MPASGLFDWVPRIFFGVSDDDITTNVGYDALVFLRFHRLSLRIMVQLSFLLLFLAPINYFLGTVYADIDQIDSYAFIRFTIANVQSGSRLLWIHCLCAFLLTLIVYNQLVREYHEFNNIRHKYLLSKEPHLRTCLITNVPEHMRTTTKVITYFANVYPHDAKPIVNLCQVSERSERALMKTSILVMNLAKWLQTQWLHSLLS